MIEPDHKATDADLQMHYVLRFVGRGGGRGVEVCTGLDVAVDAVRRHLSAGAQQILIEPHAGHPGKDEPV